MLAPFQRRAAARLTLVFLLFAPWGVDAARGQVGIGGSLPTPDYFAGVEQMYRGDYRDAIRTLQRETNQGLRILNTRWIDTVCYYAMLGEAYYQAGQLDAALRELDAACSLILQNANWMLRVRFNPAVLPDRDLGTRRAPWGVSTRNSIPGAFRENMLVSQGRLDNSNVLVEGGVVEQARFWEMDAIEVARTCAWAIKRRNDILGPLGRYDPMSADLARTLARGTTTPNHWSVAWGNVIRGLAESGVGNNQAALKSLEDGLLASRQFDHPLTCYALLEEGRLAMEAGDVAEADRLLWEASYSAYQYEDVRTVDEAFRLIARNRAAARVKDVNPAWDAIAVWARREGFNHIYSRARLAAAHDLLEGEQFEASAAALKDAQTRLRDARAGLLGIEAAMLDARLKLAAGLNSGFAAVDKVLAVQAAASPRNYRIALANGMFDDQTLPSRSAVDLYRLILRDPTPADVALDLTDTLACLSTPNQPAFDRWLTATLERENVIASMEVADLAKRRQLHQQLGWGGRLDAMRMATVAPDSALQPAALQQRRDMLSRFPDLQDAFDAESAIRDRLDDLWSPAMTDAARQQATKLWKELASAVDDREMALASAALKRVQADFAFPPVATVEEIAAQLPPGRAVLMFHESSAGLLGMLVTGQAATQWNCGPPNRIGATITELLRAIGNYDGNREIATDQLAETEWREASQKLFHALFDGSSLAPEQVEELVIIPDGAVWYVPFEALWIHTEEQDGPLTDFAQIRYAPTLGAAFRNVERWRRVRRSGVIIGDLPPGEDAAERAAAAADVTDAVENPVTLGEEFRTPAALTASLLDALVVLADVEANRGGGDWDPAPLPGERNASLADWLTLAGGGPQRIAAPGLRTLAESGGRGSRRRGDRPGDELFLATCSLMSAGAETMLLSRWRVGGQSSLQLTHDFLQEAPYAPAAESWQRSVRLLRETPLDPLTEMRVKPGKGDQQLTGDHPFFWAGYMVVDSGWRPPEPEDDAAIEEVPPAAAVQPAPADGAAAPMLRPQPDGDGNAEGPPPEPQPQQQPQPQPQQADDAGAAAEP